MGWFFKKSKEPDISSDIDNGFTLPIDDIDLSVLDNDTNSIKTNMQNKPKPRHALTPDEVLGKDAQKDEQTWETSQIPMAGGKTVEVNSATVLLYKRMMESKAAAEKKSEEQKAAKPSFTYKPPKQADNTQAQIKTEPEQKSIFDDSDNSSDNNTNPIIAKTDTEISDELSVQKKQDKPAAAPVKTTTDDENSLLSRCMPYIIDDKGHDHSEDFPPKYTLQSVEDIISSFENKAAMKVSQLYGDKIKPKSTEPTVKTFKVRPLLKTKPAPKKAEDENTNKNSSPDTQNSIKTYQASFQTIEIPVTTDTQNGKSTITFDLNDIKRATGSDLGQTKQIVISDIGEEKKDSIKEFIAPKSSDFDEIIDDLNGYTCIDDAKRVRKTLYTKKRNALLRLFVSVLFSIAVIVPRFGFFSEALSGKSDIVFTLSAVALGIMFLLNFKAITALINIKKDVKNPYLPVSLAVVAVLLHSIISIIFFDTSTVLNLVPVAAIAIFFASLGDFLRCAEIVDNFRYIANEKQKNAVDIIKDDETSGKIIKTGLEGKPYIIAPRKTVNILGFLKASYAPDALSSKIPIILISSAAVALVLGVIGFIILGNISAALTIFALAFCIASPPTTLLIGSVPLKAASSRLYENDAMICGWESAMSIEPANCVVLNANELFPESSIELINMKILGNNSLDKTFFDAAAITFSAQSPLYNVFKNVTKSLGDVKLPTCDSVKYEERMGVSGWVDDRHIFIGNRTLLEAHSIAVPSIEVDKKILKKGFFPIYVACNGEPYALLMVRYAPKKSIKYQLMRLASLGVTFYLNSTDPNVNAQMVTDYFELFDDSIYVLKSDEIKNFKDAVNYKESCFAPACFKGTINGLLAIIAESIKLKTCVSVMTALHIGGVILGIFTLLFAIFSSSFSLVTVGAVIIWQLATTIISLFALFIK